MTKYRIKTVTYQVWQPQQFFVESRFLFFWGRVGKSHRTYDAAMRAIASFIPPTVTINNVNDVTTHVYESNFAVPKRTLQELSLGEVSIFEVQPSLGTPEIIIISERQWGLRSRNDMNLFVQQLLLAGSKAWGDSDYDIK